MMGDEEYRIMQSGTQVAHTEGPNALSEIKHYAAQYIQEGGLEVQARLGPNLWQTIAVIHNDAADVAGR